ncbi:hypothetical protein GLOTRDRAFT_140954 [Gloeophyllum trabeum ATCC 11539]|uniref:Endopeptidase S2P n=1 Tax=Gloeophyllum trabeum (strain ATCC 11539 / FP-39264 / Madison 617) TaxID=670483 RepID=S7PW59_GLOTA|nr:uncharacterized protein GLOTRDRAFT_140954 [Gloeophyllum trabeum ATCC 11539]EPQ51547.1 hypothetical protein GLOTRDRAFT_140954 [Gloeophyllum trabeum ATCC 11539]
MFLNLVAIVALLWLAIHGLHKIFRSRRRDVLPLPTSSDRPSRVSTTAFSLFLQPVYLRIESTGLNARLETLATYLSDRKNVNVRRLVKRVYDVGAVLGVFGLALALAALTYATGETLFSVLAPANGTSPTFNNLTKRSSSDSAFAEGTTPQASSYSRVINPIIPGVTVPLSHLSILLVALFWNQIVHEAGHAIAATIETVDVLSVGASLYVVLPSAFVKLSSSNMELLSPRPRLRIIAAGAFHNLLTWFLLTMLVSSGLGRTLWTLVGYRDVSTYAVGVTGVEDGSDLGEYIAPGALITKLDDVSLGSSNSVDVWTAYLAGTVEHRSTGWCISEDWYLARPTACCEGSADASKAASQLACFRPSDGSTVGRCLDPLSIMVQEPASQRRCAVSSDCDSHATCITPDKDETLLRLTFIPEPFKSGEKDATQMLLWRGPRVEVLEQVRVGTLMPGRFYLPVGVPGLVGVCIEYISRP